MKIFEKVKAFTKADEFRRTGHYPYFMPRTEADLASCAATSEVMLGSNNYLGLTHHQDLVDASQLAVQQQGTSCTGSRFLNGTLHSHLVLEHELAEFHGAEKAQTFTTGYQANLGVISALAGKGDFIVLDKEAHASIIDGAMLAAAKGAQILRFKHNDTAHLAKVLNRVPIDAGCLVVVDGVYSMGGDLADLPGIVALCKNRQACLIVDDAHGVGVFGQNGRGTVDHFGLQNDVDLITGTFSKSFASLGGYVVGQASVIDFIRHHARSLIFSASMTPASAEAARAALHIMLREPERIQKLHRNAEFMRQGLAELGFDIGHSQSPIIPIFIRNDLDTCIAWRALLDAGIYTNPVVPPGVMAKDSMLRTSYMASHTRSELERALSTFKKVGLELGLIPKTKNVA